MKLRVLGRYRNDPLNVAFDKGMVVEVDDALAKLLMSDSPDSFEEIIEEKSSTRRNKRVSTKQAD